MFEKKGMLELKLRKTSGKIIIHNPLWDFIMRYHRLEKTKSSFTTNGMRKKIM